MVPVSTVCFNGQKLNGEQSWHGDLPWHRQQDQSIGLHASLRRNGPLCLDDHCQDKSTEEKLRVDLTVGACDDLACSEDLDPRTSQYIQHVSRMSNKVTQFSPMQ